MSIEDKIREAAQKAEKANYVAEGYFDTWLARLAASPRSYLVVYPVLFLALVGLITVVRWFL